jgi:hypothetical protein
LAAVLAARKQRLHLLISKYRQDCFVPETSTFRQALVLRHCDLDLAQVFRFTP